jgi:uncharacterized membrane protein
MFALMFGIIFLFLKKLGDQMSGFPSAPIGSYASSIASSTVSKSRLNATTGVEVSVAWITGRQ